MYIPIILGTAREGRESLDEMVWYVRALKTARGE